MLTIHHWTDQRRGLDELRRVASSRVVVLTWDLEAGADFWLLEYFPAIVDLDRGRFPPVDEVCEWLGARAEPAPVPYDCHDGFLGSRWRDPEAYLDGDFRAAMSGFSQLAPREVERGVERLARELRGGAWERRFGSLRELETLDLGYRLLVAEVD